MTHEGLRLDAERTFTFEEVSELIAAELRAKYHDGQSMMTTWALADDKAADDRAGAFLRSELVRTRVEHAIEDDDDPDARLMHKVGAARAAAIDAAIHEIDDDVRGELIVGAAIIRARIADTLLPPSIDALEKIRLTPQTRERLTGHARQISDTVLQEGRVPTASQAILKKLDPQPQSPLRAVLADATEVAAAQKQTVQERDDKLAVLERSIGVLQATAAESFTSEDKVVLNQFLTAVSKNVAAAHRANDSVAQETHTAILSAFGLEVSITERSAQSSNVYDISAARSSTTKQKPQMPARPQKEVVDQSSDGQQGIGRGMKALAVIAVAAGVSATLSGVDASAKTPRAEQSAVSFAYELDSEVANNIAANATVVTVSLPDSSNVTITELALNPDVTIVKPETNTAVATVTPDVQSTMAPLEIKPTIPVDVALAQAPPVEVPAPVATTSPNTSTPTGQVIVPTDTVTPEQAPPVEPAQTDQPITEQAPPATITPSAATETTTLPTQPETTLPAPATPPSSNAEQAPVVTAPGSISETDTTPATDPTPAPADTVTLPTVETPGAALPPAEAPVTPTVVTVTPDVPSQSVVSQEAATATQEDSIEFLVAHGTIAQVWAKYHVLVENAGYKVLPDADSTAVAKLVNQYVNTLDAKLMSVPEKDRIAFRSDQLAILQAIYFPGSLSNVQAKLAAHPNTALVKQVLTHEYGAVAGRGNDKTPYTRELTAALANLLANARVYTLSPAEQTTLLKHYTPAPPKPKVETAPAKPRAIPTAAEGMIKLGGDWINRGIALQFFIDHGLTPLQASGIIGNTMAESGVNPQRVQDGFGPKYSATIPEGLAGNGGYGIAQWTSKGRVAALIEFAEKMGKPVDSLEVQLNFMMHELEASYPDVLTQLKHAKTAEEAASIWMLGYERPNPQYAHEDVRRGNAKLVLAEYGNQQKKVTAAIQQQKAVAAAAHQKAIAAAAAHAKTVAVAQQKIQAAKAAASNKNLAAGPIVSKTIFGEAVPARIGGVVYYSQHDVRWANIQYADDENKQDTISSSGCGPTTQAMVITTLTGKQVTPIAMAGFNQRNGFKVDGVTAWAAFPASAQAYGLRSQKLPINEDAIKQVLKAHPDALIITNGTDNDDTTPATPGGHIFMERGLTANDKLLVNDANSISMSKEGFNPGTILAKATVAYAIYK